jgi:hypothetical protein
MNKKISKLFKSVVPTNRPLPDMIILGGQRCGTTSIYDYLSQHPQTNPSRSKEIHFFDLNYQSGLNWYRYNFNSKKNNTQLITFESSPYYLFHPAVPERVKKSLPECKFIIMLRNPIERAYSHYWHEKKYGREELSFEEALKLENQRLEKEENKLLNDPYYISNAHRRYSYFSRGCYSEQIKRWLSCFSHERFLFIESDNFFLNPEKTMNHIHKFLQIDNFNFYEFTHRNKGIYETAISNKLRKTLSDRFQENNKDLQEITGININWFD